MQGILLLPVQQFFVVHHRFATNVLKMRKDFVAGVNNLSGRQYRLMNEVPTVLLLVIVFSVIVKF